MKIYTIKFLLAAVFGIGLLPAHAQTFSDVQPSDQRDVDWADERNYQDDFAPYSESEYLPQEQIDDEAPIEYESPIDPEYSHLHRKYKTKKKSRKRGSYS